MGDEEVSDDDDDDDWSEEDDDDDESMRLDEEPFQIDQSLNLPVSLSSVQVKTNEIYSLSLQNNIFCFTHHPHCYEKKEKNKKKCSMNTYLMFYY